MLAATAIAMIRLRSLFAIVMLSGIYSLLTAAVFMTMDAVDVAFTEAAVGAGFSTVLFLSTLALTGSERIKTLKVDWPSLGLVTVTGLVLVYATLDMPYFGDPEAPIHNEIAERYIHESPKEIGPPNMVTSVLASYRGYDTLGETAVVFSAVMGVLLLLGAGKPQKRNRER